MGRSELFRKFSRLKNPAVWRGLVANCLFTKYFKTKLDQNYHSLTYPERFLYWVWYRRKMSKEDRFFFEGCLGLPGQMYICDRRGLYEAILQHKPANCYEIGTWTGGGSTFFLASALAKVGSGRLYTMESSDHLYRKAKTFYSRSLPKLNEFVEFVHGDEFADLEPFFQQSGGVSSLFLDGAEDAQQTLDQYQAFLPYLKSGSILMAHDWFTEKTELVKPVLLGDGGWELLSEIKPPESVGFAVFRRR